MTKAERSLQGVYCAEVQLTSEREVAPARQSQRDRPARTPCQTSQPPPISARAASKKTARLRATSAGVHAVAVICRARARSSAPRQRGAAVRARPHGMSAMQGARLSAAAHPCARRKGCAGGPPPARACAAPHGDRNVAAQHSWSRSSRVASTLPSRNTLRDVLEPTRTSAAVCWGRPQQAVGRRATLMRSARWQPRRHELRRGCPPIRAQLAAARSIDVTRKQQCSLAGPCAASNRADDGGARAAIHARRPPSRRAARGALCALGPCPAPRASTTNNEPISELYCACQPLTRGSLPARPHIRNSASSGSGAQRALRAAAHANASAPRRHFAFSRLSQSRCPSCDRRASNTVARPVMGLESLTASVGAAFAPPDVGS